MAGLTSTTIRGQLRRNAVALISLFVAVSSLGYNTWRNESSEHNRNQRLVSIEILLKLGQLQEIVFHNHYDRDATLSGNPRTGWALVLTIEDLAQVLEAPLPESAELLAATWTDHWDDLGRNQAGADAILLQIDTMRSATGALLRELD